MKWFLRLFFIPMAQAMLMAVSQIAINRFLFVAAFFTAFALNLCWWYNTRANYESRHLWWSGPVYAGGFSTGILLGMWLFQRWGGTSL